MHIHNIFDANCFNKIIVNIPYKNFPCLMTDDTLTWDNHIDQLISGLKSAYYAITAVQHCCQGKLSECYILIMYFLSYPTA